MSVERYQLSPSLEISRAVSGLWQIADMERDGVLLDTASTAAAMSPYLDAGLTTFDMADHYGSAELIAGYFRRHQRAGRPLQTLTKWVPKPGPVNRMTVRSAVEERMARLEVDQIELLQFHAWRFSDPSWLDALFYLQELVDEGLIANLGTTNFDTAHLRVAHASGIRLVSNQVCYSLLDQRAGDAMTSFCLEAGISLLAYGTVAGGLLSDRWLGAEEPHADALPTWSLMKYKRFVDVIGGWSAFQQLLHEARAIASELGVTIAQVASRFILQQQAVAGVIIGARLGQSEHVSQTADLFSFTLDDGQMARLRAVTETFERIHGDCGDEYRTPPFLTASGDLSHHLADFPAPYPVTRTGDGRQRIDTGTTWERTAGYSRAVRVGNSVSISGTTATHGDVLVGGNDPYAQTHFIIDKIEGVLASFGGSLSDVTRTRIFVADIDAWEDAARAHGERFAGIRPANTLVEARLVGAEYLVEIEAEATL